MKTLSLSCADHASLAKLLLNAWSAEYALRIVPVTNGPYECEQARYWTFPQAYYAAMFSARAVLLLDGIDLRNLEALEQQMHQWSIHGVYGPYLESDTFNNPLAELIPHRLQSGTKPPVVNRTNAEARQRRLVDVVASVALVHEAYIADRIGPPAYQALIDAMPSYLREGFVAARLSSNFVATLRQIRPCEHPAHPTKEPVY